MSDFFLTCFKWFSWALISVVFYIFFLKEFIQLEIQLDYGDNNQGLFSRLLHLTPRVHSSECNLPGTIRPQEGHF